MGNEVESIPQTRRVIYTTYALFPTGGLKVGDLAYATDTRCLYRWNGTSWDVITIYSLAGLAADIPAAGTLPNGSIYFATDTFQLYIKQGAAWLSVAGASATSGHYTGNDAVNRAIAHGLGSTPKLVTILSDSSIYHLFILPLVAAVLYLGTLAVGTRAVTVTDGTSFYVGNADADKDSSANASGKEYYWTAFK